MLNSDLICFLNKTYSRQVVIIFMVIVLVVVLNFNMVLFLDLSKTTLFFGLFYIVFEPDVTVELVQSYI